MKKGAIDLRMRENVIYVRAENNDMEFLGHIHSAEKIDPEKAKASFQNGLLDIKVPLKERTTSAAKTKID